MCNAIRLLVLDNYVNPILKHLQNLMNTHVMHISRTFYIYCQLLAIDMYGTRVYAGCCLFDGEYIRTFCDNQVNQDFGVS
jgi:hypothetical protein